jgi:hypothetical protein
MIRLIFSSSNKFFNDVRKISFFAQLLADHSVVGLCFSGNDIHGLPVRDRLFVLASFVLVTLTLSIELGSQGFWVSAFENVHLTLHRLQHGNWMAPYFRVLADAAIFIEGCADSGSYTTLEFCANPS